MLALFRHIYNALYRSAHRFSDGSALYHMIRYESFRYYSGDGFHRITDLPITYDVATGLSWIDLDAILRWRNPQIPLGEPSDSGLVLTEAPKVDLSQKLRVFIAKQGDRFEPLQMNRR